VVRPTQELMRDGVCKHSSTRLPYLTVDWEIGPHMTLLKEARREGVVGKGEKNAHVKSIETENESRGFKKE
jgi:hypothetical protein